MLISVKLKEASSLISVKSVSCKRQNLMQVLELDFGFFFGEVPRDACEAQWQLIRGLKDF